MCVGGGGANNLMPLYHEGFLSFRDIKTYQKIGESRFDLRFQIHHPVLLRCDLHINAKTGKKLNSNSFLKSNNDWLKIKFSQLMGYRVS